ncbi:Fe2+-enterobactin ABC transporter substrate-binding protein [Kocuria sp. TGY1127_2]|uniref:Fe2+-enterobactin ABC transporter substrate-binding protein n=1 Tax=Kocuria sp. TGY1127_2 TaxID=2711328 RepID=UPI0015BA44D5|nr:Fe2+-enterobactin ABC transporter substrate-binding protein [Kocuria sp. TGY1127_2]
MRAVATKMLWVRGALAFAVALMLAIALAACGDSGSSKASADASSSSAEKWPRTITTDDGELKIDKKPEKIVSTSTTLTGSLLAVGAPVVASGATKENVPDLSDDQGFFNQWSKAATEKNVKKLWSNDSPNIEKVADYEPDLIVVAKNSGDSVFDKVDQLKKMGAPVLVVDYSDKSWQDVTTKVAEATGREKAAEDVIKDFDQRLSEVKNKIKVPEEEVSPFIVFGDGSGAAALTDKAPQVQILEKLGFKITTIPDEVKGDTSMGKDRGDMVNLSPENVQKGLPGKVWLAVAADDSNKKVIHEDKAFNTSPAVKDGKVYYTPGETFRLDYYSAKMELDSLEKDFAK